MNNVEIGLPKTDYLGITEAISERQPYLILSYFPKIQFRKVFPFGEILKPPFHLT